MYDSFINLDKDVSPNGLLTLFPSFFPAELLVFPVLVLRPFNFCLSKVSPKAFFFLIFYFSFIMLISFDVCNLPDLPATRNGCVNNANVMAFGKSTEGPCSVLKDIHSRLLIWGNMHGASFPPINTSLFSFPRKSNICPSLILNYPLLCFTPAPVPAFLALSLTLSSLETLTLHTSGKSCIPMLLPLQDSLY